MSYAEKTTVPVEKSRMEIERMLTRYGASHFAYAWDGSTAVLGFRMGARTIRFRLNLPPKDSAAYTRTPARRKARSPAGAEAAWEQECRRRWRALALMIKAKFEAQKAGITSFEDEFLAYTVLPDGRTLGEWAAPQLNEANAAGAMPALLPPPGGPTR